MPIEFEVSDINSVEEEIRNAYVEKDGKHVFDPEKFYELKAASLLNKNKQLLDEKKKLAEEKRLLEGVKKSAETDIDKVVAQKDQEIKTLRQQLRESSIWTPVQQLAVKYGVLPDRLDAMMKILRVDARFDQDDESKLVFNDKYGDPTAIKPERAFEYHLKEEMPWAFAAPTSGGSGAKNGTKAGPGRVITRERFDSMTEAERGEAMSKGARIVD
jgi:hypothetical protein